ncbi:23S rRNA (adenine(2030)-N(6))-methyltransferase RlmJ [Vibrio fluvialis]|uniref:23S rRNA (adenine(2030)-N(6))-methyltransferase RlmJ n=1 Tax=Vibrio sp. bablab_jr001 TaxID=2755067 RepID=UPI0018F268FF|nr:23S rRNA (adenine(2030)-N(6))-methyltransferase RlmJ [Vibrio sp. bablab_jr001]EKO3401246.1 23S rRNA (adenine(2030)-N(6))-methyltransferase RlmJ [Vibrio fluvialis]EKO3475445.1 23S rRNA (adenine(2030)-N(6))-methyltransferase RlmJ [Vibrio fluvialis]MBY8118102.1 23S rRNA (adenine(2030)-N(6))-methyltransferase RlmJ [Vibrio fluvialis]MBY8250616.1 23S rRNA (adenine(2030)-N(6))-methyltransferase RlmJ [Vibrio fluvialis]MBY8284226.1 23S rRNA (adenine(2030)-N(6))-methyltransferase RlmJ [Vibrio fluvial
MLSYRHSFHAGNHADVVKHIVQSLILSALQQKDKPFVYHDTHSGVGRYDLTHEWSEKTGEYKQGIARLWQQTEVPEDIHCYLDAIKALNDDGELRYYPGSPRVARAHLRSHDRMVLTELHPSDYPLLEQEFHRDRQVAIFKEDGFARLKGSLPPKERRGLVLIDPPYELAKEYRDVVQAIAQSYKRWATGIYAIWYPVVNRCDIDDMIEGLQGLGIRKILQIELGVSPDTNERGMTASGMIVINPPWKLESQMQSILPFLKEAIAPATGHYKVEWIVPE